ncbi:MAG: acyltransferase [Candidatus Omnitrophica bacterium]|nr:acyltransferase [Candidatus Omnitrophota bacterium]
MREYGEHAKLFAKWLISAPRGARLANGAYISPLCELRGARRITLGGGAVLERYARLYANGKNARITIGDGTTIYPYALLKANGGTIEIGSHSSVNDYSILYGYGGIRIGSGVHIAAHTVIVASEHDYEKLGTPRFSVDMRGKGIVVEDNVWIGANAVILDGVTIGTYSVIGAGAVVSESIPPYSIAVGIPAKVVRKWK